MRNDLLAASDVSWTTSRDNYWEGGVGVSHLRYFKTVRKFKQNFRNIAYLSSFSRIRGAFSLANVKKTTVNSNFKSQHVNKSLTCQILSI